MGWVILGLITLAAACLLRWSAPLFSYDIPLRDTPVLPFVASYVTLGLICGFCIPSLIRATPTEIHKLVLFSILLLGGVLRLLQFGTEPILEDDYYRYLWDGAITTSGYSPYTNAPEDFLEGSSTVPDLQSLSARAETVLERVNYPELRTIYPPIAQGGFALAHWVSSLNLEAWRAVALLAEAMAMGFLLLILRKLGHSPIWVALYWWHPVPVKEIANSLHMEPLLMLPIMLAGWLILHHRLTLASIMLAIAAGVKIWPVALAPVLWRQNLRQPGSLVCMVGLTAFTLAIMIWPIMQAGLDHNSGFVAFARDWRASSAAYLVAEGLARGLDPTSAPVLARLFLILIGLAGMIWLCRTSAPDPQVVFRRFAVAIALVYLLLPSQTPWYFLWIAPFLCIFPSRGLMLAGALIPLHYMYFYFAPLDLDPYYNFGIVWLIWLPVWGLLLCDLISQVSSFQTSRSGRHAR